MLSNKIHILFIIFLINNIFFNQISLADKNKYKKKMNCPENMSWIPSGEFMMGCNSELSKCYGEEKPMNKVLITKGFCMDKKEVTQGEYEKVIGTNPSYFKDCGKNCPIDSVFWDDAKDYCTKLNKRLPTEAEWELAARGGTNTKYFWGNDMNGDYTWYGGNSKSKPEPVGLKKPNQYGLYDMIGNVWEWTYDFHDSKWYKRMPLIDPLNNKMKKNETIERHVVRGGSWLYFSDFLRTSVRMGLKVKNKCIPVGFRCAK